MDAEHFGRIGGLSELYAAYRLDNAAIIETAAEIYENKPEIFP